jgi:hypothetical protein
MALRGVAAPGVDCPSRVFIFVTAEQPLPALDGVGFGQAQATIANFRHTELFSQ